MLDRRWGPAAHEEGTVPAIVHRGALPGPGICAVLIVTALLSYYSCTLEFTLRVYDSVVFSMFTKSCSCRYRSQNVFRKRPWTHRQPLSIPSACRREAALCPYEFACLRYLIQVESCSRRPL